MPKPLYLHPFLDPNHYMGMLGKTLGVQSAKLSLHFVAPTFGSARFRYLGEMGRNSVDLANYTNATDRIYVMGHCSPGSHELSTESWGNDGIRTGDESCAYDELHTLFQRHGLPRASNVVIRIHACYSARSDPAGADNSFAHLLKNCMNRTHPNVTIQGYDSSVGMYLGYRWGKYPLSSANKHRITIP
ncbi:hypothetical protein [Roseateles sp. P5_E7]